MQSWCFIFLWGSCRGLAGSQSPWQLRVPLEYPQWDFLITGKKQTAPSQPFSGLGFWGNSLELLLASVVRCWLVSPRPLETWGGVGKGEEEGGWWMERLFGSQVKVSRSGLGELGQTWLSLHSWSTRKCLVTEAGLVPPPPPGLRLWEGGNDAGIR